MQFRFTSACQPFSRRIIFSIFVSISWRAIIAISSAYAGGFEDDYSSISDVSSPINEIVSFHSELADPATSGRSSERSSSRLTPNWQNWSEPYVDGNSICRESNGNLACLTPASAEHLRW